MAKSLFEELGGKYERQGDYLIPCLTVPAEEEQAIGIWGQRHLDYLKQYRKVTYTNLLTSGRLNAYLADINRQAQERFERLIEGMKQAQGITEQLKAENALEWTGCLNNIRACAREIGSLKDEVKENTVQEVRKALQANIEAIQRATKLLEKQSDTLTSVMKQKIRELEESKNSFFRYEGLKLYLFWGGMVCNILVFLMLLYGMLGK